MSRGLYKKMTREDKFARKYYCNSYRFVHDMKKRNRKKLRRISKTLEVIAWERARKEKAKSKEQSSQL